MLNPSSPLAALLAAPMRPGTVSALLLRPARHADPVPCDRLVLDPVRGVEGDHYAGRSGNRQVTLIQAEDIAAIAAHLGRDALPPALLRRNVVVAGLNLRALLGARLQVGTALVKVTGEAHPCSRMETTLGTGGYNAVRGRGGLVARVLGAGTVALGDAVSRAG